MVFNQQGNYCKSYSFKNITNVNFFLKSGDVGIYTTFNDDYISSEACLTNRCHTHIIEVDSMVRKAIDKWKQVLDVILNSTFHVTRYVIPHMLGKKQGKIIMIRGKADDTEF